MSFDEPIYLDRVSLQMLMDDTDQHRVCWVYHDVLSDSRIAGIFDKYAGKGAPIHETWTAMAWVAASQQENGFYLLFKWYDHFYGPPRRGDLYYIERNPGLEGGLRIRFLNMDFQYKYGSEVQAWCRSLWSRVSRNANRFFGESDYRTTAISRIQQVTEGTPGREFEAVDWLLRRRTDGEKARECATISAYFQSIQAIQEIIYYIVVTDGSVNDIHHMHTGEIWEIGKRLQDSVDGKKVSESSRLFRRLSEGFVPPPPRAPYLGRNVGRMLLNQSAAGTLRWLQMRGPGSRRFLRECYWKTDPRSAWDVFHRWQGEIFFTVVRRPTIREMPRGIYILSRFEDQTGKDVTDLFWMETIEEGVTHLCQGDFFDELLDELLELQVGEAVFPNAPWGKQSFTQWASIHLKQIYENTIRGRG